MDRDLRLLAVPLEALEPAPLPIVSIGGSVRTLMIRDVEVAFVSDEGELMLRHDLWVVQHDLDRLPPEEVSRVVRLPSVLGRGLINRFRLTSDYRTGTVELES